jgi:hypothetical protein
VRIYLISSLGQPKRRGTHAWGLGVRLATLHRKNRLVMKDYKKSRTCTDSLDIRP